MAKYVLSSPAYFENLLSLIEEEEAPLPQRASWVLFHAHRIDTSFTIPYLNRIIDLMFRPFHSSVYRNATSILLTSEIPEERLTEVYEQCIDWVILRKQEVAIRANSLEVLAKIVIRYPELIHEVMPIVEDLRVEDSAAIKSRIRKFERLTKHIPYDN